MSYKKLRSFFLENMEHLPKTLAAAPHIYYNDVKGTVAIYINQIDSFVKNNGRDEANRHRPTLAALNNLRQLKKHLENLEGWDKPKPPHNPFHNRMDGEIVIPQNKVKRK